MWRGGISLTVSNVGFISDTVWLQHVCLALLFNTQCKSALLLSSHLRQDRRTRNPFPPLFSCTKQLCKPVSSQLTRFLLCALWQHDIWLHCNLDHLKAQANLRVAFELWYASIFLVRATLRPEWTYKADNLWSPTLARIHELTGNLNNFWIRYIYHHNFWHFWF